MQVHVSWSSLLKWNKFSHQEEIIMVIKCEITCIRWESTKWLIKQWIMKLMGSHMQNMSSGMIVPAFIIKLTWVFFFFFFFYYGTKIWQDDKQVEIDLEYTCTNNTCTLSLFCLIKQKYWILLRSLKCKEMYPFELLWKMCTNTYW